MIVNIYCIDVYRVVCKCTYRTLQCMLTLSPTHVNTQLSITLQMYGILYCVPSCCLCAKPFVCLLVDYMPCSFYRGDEIEVVMSDLKRANQVSPWLFLTPHHNHPIKVCYEYAKIHTTHIHPLALVSVCIFKKLDTGVALFQICSKLCSRKYETWKIPKRKSETSLLKNNTDT